MGWIWAAGYENEGPLWCSVNWICIILFSHHWCWWKLSWLWIGLFCSGDNVAMLAWQYFFYRFTSRFDDEYNMKSIFRSQFLKMGEDDGEEKEPCCPLRLRTGGKLSRITRSMQLNFLFTVVFSSDQELSLSGRCLPSSPGFFSLSSLQNWTSSSAESISGHSRWNNDSRRTTYMLTLLFYFTAIHCQSVIFRRKYQEGVSLQWLAS